MKKNEDIRVRESARIVKPSGKILSREYRSYINKERAGEIEYVPDLKTYKNGFHKSNDPHIKKGDSGIALVYTERGKRNKGVGKKLMNKAISTAKKEKKKRVLLEVRSDNKKAMNIYNILKYIFQFVNI